MMACVNVFARVTREQEKLKKAEEERAAARAAAEKKAAEDRAAAEKKAAADRVCKHDMQRAVHDP